MTQTPTDALRLVPVEPTEAMVADGVKAAQRAEQTCVSWPEMVSFTYRAMLSAAPASPLPGGGNEALIAELKEARAIMADVQRSTQGPSLDGRIRAFLASNGKGEG